jgi:hypothetical protein
VFHNNVMVFIKVQTIVYEGINQNNKNDVQKVKKTKSFVVNLDNVHSLQTETVKQPRTGTEFTRYAIYADNGAGVKAHYISESDYNIIIALPALALVNIS